VKLGAGLAVALLVLSASACGDAGRETATARAGLDLPGNVEGQVNYHGRRDVRATVEEEEEVLVDAGDFFYKPTLLEVPASSSVRITVRNVGLTDHHFDVIPSQGDVIVRPGGRATVEYEMPSSGTLEYMCLLHREFGMHGVFVVR
jgi:plastocyanin